MVVDNRTIPGNKILHQLFVLLNTTRGEVPLFRDFGVDARNIDKPVTIIGLSIFTELESQIKKYIKNISLKDVSCIVDEIGLKIVCEVEINE